MHCNTGSSQILGQTASKLVKSHGKNYSVMLPRLLTIFTTSPALVKTEACSLQPTGLSWRGFLQPATRQQHSLHKRMPAIMDTKGTMLVQPSLLWPGIMQCLLQAHLVVDSCGCCGHRSAILVLGLDCTLPEVEELEELDEDDEDACEGWSPFASPSA